MNIWQKTALGIFLTSFLVVMAAGFYIKSTFKDLNEQDDALSQFAVAQLTDDLFDYQLELMEDELMDSNIIICAQCLDTTQFRFKCTTQVVKVTRVIKGDGLAAGDEISIARAASLVMTDSESEVGGYYIMDTSFVNEMIPGMEYLVFLDRKLETEEAIYIQPEEFMIAPMFCFEDVQNQPAQTLNDTSTYVSYDSVGTNEFFLDSDEAYEKIYEFKAELFEELQIR